MFTLSPTPAAIALLSAMLLLAIVQIVYHFVIYGKLVKHKYEELGTYHWQSVSIIICARNEYENLQRLVPALLEQDYPDFEIIIVDDASWDQTTSYLEKLDEEEPRVKAVFVTDEMKKYYLGKKLALSLGIKAATHELLLLTDADCIPQGNQWIKHMVQPYHANPATEIVLGYSPFNKTGSMVNLVARMDNLYTAMSYFSYAVRKNPYMGVGRNLSYKKSLFFKNKGFASHLHIASGDDDLFIRDTANAENTAFTTHPDSFVYTDAKETMKDWYTQKKRHNFVGKYYLPKHKMALATLGISHVLFWLCFIASCFFVSSLGWSLCILGLLWLVKLPLLYINFKKFRQANMAFWMPVFDILYLFYNGVFGVVTVFSRQKKW